MQVSRRFLPAMPLLTALEATARTASVTLAARELCLTQSAVSRQVIALEQQLGITLFHRERQIMKLTAEGAAYVAEIREGLQKISMASMSARANPHGGTLSLAILPTFGTRWLAPRLGNFLSTYQGISINLITKMDRFDFNSESIDAAIHFGHDEWTGAELQLLRRETILPVCSKAVLAQYAFGSPADLCRAPLLHLNSRPDAWREWMLHHGANGDIAQNLVFDQFAFASQAAVAGLGVALLPTFLIEEELAAGKLVAALPMPMQNSQAYYLAWPKPRDGYPPLCAFRSWIAEQARQDAIGEMGR